MRELSAAKLHLGNPSRRNKGGESCRAAAVLRRLKCLLRACSAAYGSGQFYLVFMIEGEVTAWGFETEASLIRYKLKISKAVNALLDVNPVRQLTTWSILDNYSSALIPFPLQCA